MDGLAALLDGPRARGAFLLRVPDGRRRGRCGWRTSRRSRSRPWCAGRRGRSRTAATPFRLEAGDVVIALRSRPLDGRRRTGRPRRRSRRSTRASVCTTPDGRVARAEEMHQGVRSWGNSATGETVMLTGAYLLEGEVSRRLLRALPRFAGAARSASSARRWCRCWATRSSRTTPGQDAVLDRLLDLLLIAVLRAWFARPDADPPAWYVGQGDAGRRPGPAADAAPPRATRGRWPSLAAAGGCRGRRSPAGSPRWWAYRR